MLYYTILYYTVLYHTVIYSSIVYYTILYYTVLYPTTLYYTILYYMILYCIILYYIILNCFIVYYTVLYYTQVGPGGSLTWPAASGFRGGWPQCAGQSGRRHAPQWNLGWYGASVPWGHYTNIFHQRCFFYIFVNDIIFERSKVFGYIYTHWRTCFSLGHALEPELCPHFASLIPAGRLVFEIVKIN